MRIVSILLAVFLLSGCTHWIAKKLVSAPQEHTELLIPEKYQGWFEETYELPTFKIPVTESGLEIAVTVIPARDYNMDFKFISVEDTAVKVDFDIGDEDGELEPLITPVRGTLVLLPGATAGRYSMLHWALGLASEGYRAVLMDYRGHGDSDGQYITYGMAESRDLKRVVAALEQRRLITQPLILFGVSMGASTALLAAPEMGSLDAVVAFEPFTDAPRAIASVGRALNPYMSWFVSDERLMEAIEVASEISGFDLMQSRPIDAMEHISIPVLLVHGQDDEWVPPQNSIELYLAKQGKAELWIIPDAVHMTLPMQYDRLKTRVFDWLDAALSSPDARHSP